MALMTFDGRVAFITGASRGIGRAIALALAENGCDIVVAAKSTESTELLPGSINHTAAEVERIGRRALPVQVDVRNDAMIARAVGKALDEFGRIDYLINNAGALHWRSLLETPMKRFDLVMGVNARAAFACTLAVLPHMIERGYGHILMMSPPIQPEAAAGKIAYTISKFGMTLIAHGLAEEVRASNVACNALWPATLIETMATVNHNLGGPATWRKPDILCDATLKIFAKEPRTFTGHELIDEDFLRSEGVTDFSRYRCDPATEPPRIGFKFRMEAGKID
jgi:citronellol/citronellal dehydrogenase